MKKKGIKKVSIKMKNKMAHSRRSCEDCFKEFHGGKLHGRKHCQSNKEGKWSAVIFTANLNLSTGSSASYGYGGVRGVWGSPWF